MDQAQSELLAILHAFTLRHGSERGKFLYFRGHTWSWAKTAPKRTQFSVNMRRIIKCFADLIASSERFSLSSVLIQLISAGNDSHLHPPETSLNPLDALSRQLPNFRLSSHALNRPLGLRLLDHSLTACHPHRRSMWIRCLPPLIESQAQLPL